MVGENLWMLSYTARPPRDGYHDAQVKLSSSRMRSLASLRHVGAGSAHGDADVRVLERGRVVHPVPVTATISFCAAQRLHHPELGRRPSARR